MTLEVKIHDAQTSILRELLFVRDAGYAELQKPTGLTSDHFNFHISRLVELGMVEKVGRGRYKLTIKGKEYANKLDTDRKTIERQPKVAVLLGVEREHKGQRQLLFQKRTKNPYYGYLGFPTGKITWGETIAQTAARELMEETGLEAEYEIRGLYHEHTTIEGTDEKIEDKMFFVVRCINHRGKLIEKFEGGENSWMSLEEARKYPKRYSSFETELEMVEGKLNTFVEEHHFYSSEEF
ncbi:MAG TPA: NUDIX hydrolase [Candidatus Saccharimonadales bacterium]|nr:NUDIX hydrolase [Candidatus Saccharimonadales bacterium]